MSASRRKGFDPVLPTRSHAGINEMAKSSVYVSQLFNKSKRYVDTVDVDRLVIQHQIHKSLERR